MEVKQLEREEVREYVKLLLKCNEDLARIFEDVFIALDVMTEHYLSLDDYTGIIVAKIGRRIAGLLEIWVRGVERGISLKNLTRTFGFLKGVKVKLLHSFFNIKPKRDEAYFRYFCIHPSASLDVGRALLDRGIELVREMGKRKVFTWLPVESDLVDVCIERGFEIKRMLDSSFAEKHFGRRYYYLLQKTLD